MMNCLNPIFACKSNARKKCKDYFTKAYRKPLIHRIIDFLRYRLFKKKIRNTDLMELTRFQKFCEENPINADMSYLERLHEVFR